MSQFNYKYVLLTPKTPEETFNILLDISQWWLGIFGETITGNSSHIGDEFSFEAGNGAHYSKQKLIELVPDKKIEWQVVKSNLTFLKNKEEWNNSTIGFEMDKLGSTTQVTFTHTGLTPKLECYDSCSTAWTKYMERLKDKLS